MATTVITEEQGAVRIVSINRPKVHNCVDGATAVALAEAIEAFAADARARVLVVTGVGDAAFCAGADLKNPESLFAHRYLDGAGPMGFARLDPGKPTIAAVNGYCFAGGFELAAWCDFRVASANAEFGCLSRRWGVPYVDGGTQRFARIMGTGHALYLLQTGVRIDARRAYAMGFVQEVVPPGQALARALELARSIAAYPNQDGIRADRGAALATHGLSLSDGLSLEARHGRATLASEDMRAALARFASGDRQPAPRPAEAPGASTEPAPRALAAGALRPFVPSGSDYDASRRLFAALGFAELWEHEGYAGFRNGAAEFILQRFDDPHVARNLMMRLDVPDLDAWWDTVSARDLARVFPGVRIAPPTDYPWGREVHVIDLAGVCWHVGEPSS